jgi:hypothetical protein
MSEVNLFDLFREAVFDRLHEEREVRELSPEARERIQEAYACITKGFFGPAPVDYSEPNRRIAYSLHYAPKHAYLWRRYARTVWTPPTQASVILNSLGTGPASEIVGLADAYRGWGLNRLTAYCYDRLDAWCRLAQAVVARYSQTTGFEIELNWVSSIDSFCQGRHLVGSFVLSEVIRQQKIGSFLDCLASAVPGASSTFLEPTGVTTLDRGPVRLLEYAGECRCRYVSALGSNWSTEINDARSACSDVICGARLQKEPELHFLTYKFDP